MNQILKGITLIITPFILGGIGLSMLGGFAYVQEITSYSQQENFIVIIAEILAILTTSLIITYHSIKPLHDWIDKKFPEKQKDDNLC